MIIKNPVFQGEPLKGNFRGFYSTPVKKNFLIIFLYRDSCRKKSDDVDFLLFYIFIKFYIHNLRILFKIWFRIPLFGAAKIHL